MIRLSACRNLETTRGLESVSHSCFKAIRGFGVLRAWGGARSSLAVRIVLLLRICGFVVFLQRASSNNAGTATKIAPSERLRQVVFCRGGCFPRLPHGIHEFTEHLTHQVCAAVVLSSLPLWRSIMAMYSPSFVSAAERADHRGEPILEGDSPC